MHQRTPCIKQRQQECHRSLPVIHRLHFQSFFFFRLNLQSYKYFLPVCVLFFSELNFVPVYFRIMKVSSSIMTAVQVLPISYLLPHIKCKQPTAIYIHHGVAERKNKKELQLKGENYDMSAIIYNVNNCIAIRNIAFTLINTTNNEAGYNDEVYNTFIHRLISLIISLNV